MRALERVFPEPFRHATQHQLEAVAKDIFKSSDPEMIAKSSPKNRVCDLTSYESAPEAWRLDDNSRPPRQKPFLKAVLT